MHLNKNRAVRAAGIAIGFVLTATLALAGEASFQLPVETHFGNVTLSPGNYRIMTPSSTSSVRVVYFYGGGKLRAILPLTVGNEPGPGSYLQMVSVDGKYYVQTYNAGMARQTFTFPIPKSVEKAASVRKITATAEED